MTNAQIVRDACQVIWSEGDVSRISEFYGEGFKADYKYTDWGLGLAGIEALVVKLRGAFPDYREEINELIDAGDKIIVRLTIRGTQSGSFEEIPPTGKTFEFNDVTICKVEDGKIITQSGLSDYFSFFLQLGLIEMPKMGS
ncbi:MAG: putative ester cyclase [Flavobacterium sp.]|jgi:predicted ester cyclase